MWRDKPGTVLALFPQKEERIVEALHSGHQEF